MADRYRQGRSRGDGGGRRKSGMSSHQSNGGDTATHRLVDLIVRLGDNTNASTLESQLLDLIPTLDDPLHHQIVFDTIFRCVVALPCKTSLYAVLVALMCAGKPELIAQAVSKFKSNLTSALLNCSYYSAKFLLRFAMELVNCNFLPIHGVHALYELILKETIDIDGLPQHIPDFYATVIISALLLDKQRRSPEKILQLLDKHVSSRKSLSWLSPFPNVTTSIIDSNIGVHQASPSPDKDSFELLHKQMLDYLSTDANLAESSPKESNPSSTSSPNLRIVLKPFSFASVSQKLFGSDAENTTNPVAYTDEIDWFDENTTKGASPTSLITFKAWVDSENQKRTDLGLEPLIYPDSLESCSFTLPRPTFYIFPKQRTSGEGPNALSDLERWFFEDYALDIIHFFRSTHADIPKFMLFGRHLHDYFDYEALVCEIIFKDFLRLPASPYPPVHHGVILLDFVQRSPTFTPVLEEATDRVFASTPSLHHVSRIAFVDWFSYHLSNTTYRWHWKDWALIVKRFDSNAMDALGVRSNPYVHLIQEVLYSLIRLSYYDKIAPLIHAAVPEEAEQWLPPSPAPSEPTGFYASPLSKSIHEVIQDRQKPPEAVFEPILAFGTAVPLPSEQVLQCTVRAILVEGSASITLLQSMLNRYHDVLHQLAYGVQTNLETPRHAGKRILEACLEYHARSPQHFVIVVLALMHHKLLSAEIVVSFLLQSERVEEHGDRLSWWELIPHTVRYLTQTHQVSELEIVNKWKLACRSDPEGNPQEIAKKVLEQPEVKENLEQIEQFTTRSKPLLTSIYVTFLELIPKTSDRMRSTVLGHFTATAIKYRKLFAASLASLEPTVAKLSTEAQTLFEHLAFLAKNY